METCCQNVQLIIFSKLKVGCCFQFPDLNFSSLSHLISESLHISLELELEHECKNRRWKCKHVHSYHWAPPVHNCEVWSHQALASVGRWGHWTVIMLLTTPPIIFNTWSRHRSQVRTQCAVSSSSVLPVWQAVEAMLFQAPSVALHWNI